MLPPRILAPRTKYPLDIFNDDRPLRDDALL